MTLILHELKRNRLPLIIWTYAIAVMLGICVFIYPMMAPEMENLGDMFAEMGELSAAFGMDTLKISDFMGYFALECGEMLGLGGGIFAAILGASILAKEEKERTAELLLTHPISRKRIVTHKLLAMLIQILILNGIAVAITAAGIIAIEEDVEASKIALLFLSGIVAKMTKDYFNKDKLLMK